MCIDNINIDDNKCVVFSCKVIRMPKFCTMLRFKHHLSKSHQRINFRKVVAMKQMMVIGAGPAGIAAAITAKQYGFNVFVVEQESSTAEKICGDALTQKSVSVLNSLGVTPAMLRGAGANEIRFNIHIAPDKKCIVSHEPNTYFTLRRCQLMQLLREKAIALGVTIQYNTPYAKNMTADYIIDASGCQRKQIGLSKKFPAGLSAIIRAETDLAQNSLYFVHHKKSDNGYCWAFPLLNNLWNIGIWHQRNANCIKKSFNKFERHLHLYLNNIEYIRNPCGALLGTIRDIPPLVSGAFPCGDAAGSCNPFSGEGISFALASGIKLIERIVALNDTENTASIGYPSKIYDNLDISVR